MKGKKLKFAQNYSKTHTKSGSSLKTEEENIMQIENPTDSTFITKCRSMW